MAASAIRHVNALDPQPDLVLFTGDLVDSGQAEQYDQLRVLLGELVAPYRLIPGNHDDREVVREAFFGERPADERLNAVVDLDPLQVILLDDVLPGSPSGELGPDQLAWLDETLAGVPGKPAVVALHHPPFRTAIEHMDRMGLVDAAAFEAVVRRHPQIEAVICGHLHRPITTRWAGTIAVTAPSVAHQVSLDLGPEAPATFTLEPPAILLHHWSSAGGLVSHLSYVGHYDGPYRFPHG